MYWHMRRVSEISNPPHVSRPLLTLTFGVLSWSQSQSMVLIHSLPFNSSYSTSGPVLNPRFLYYTPSGSFPVVLSCHGSILVTNTSVLFESWDEKLLLKATLILLQFVSNAYAWAVKGVAGDGFLSLLNWRRVRRVLNMLHSSHTSPFKVRNYFEPGLFNCWQRI